MFTYSSNQKCKKKVYFKMSNGFKSTFYECVDIADSDHENDHLRDPLDDADVKDVKLLAEDVWGL
jgi:hypothetical protein